MVPEKNSDVSVKASSAANYKSALASLGVTVEGDSVVINRYSFTVVRSGENVAVSTPIREPYFMDVCGSDTAFAIVDHVITRLALPAPTAFLLVHLFSAARHLTQKSRSSSEESNEVVVRSFAQLASSLGVAESSIYRDFRSLADHALISYRRRGSGDDSYEIRLNIHTWAKRIVSALRAVCGEGAAPRVAIPSRTVEMSAVARRRKSDKPACGGRKSSSGRSKCESAAEPVSAVQDMPAPTDRPAPTSQEAMYDVTDGKGVESMSEAQQMEYTGGCVYDGDVVDYDRKVRALGPMVDTGASSADEAIKMMCDDGDADEEKIVFMGAADTPFRN